MTGSSLEPLLPALELDVEEEFSAMRDIVKQLREYETRFEKLDAAIHNLHSEFQSTFNTAFDQIIARLDSLNSARLAQQLAERNRADELVHEAKAQKLLTRWPWIDKSTICAIANGEFGFTLLPKLHQEENIRRRYALPTDALPLFSVFPDVTTFLGAWLIYSSIRSTYTPERGPALLVWTELLLFHHQKGFPWKIVLEYASAYFEKHQNSVVEIWFSTDHELIAQYLVTPPPISTVAIVPSSLAPMAITPTVASIPWARRSPPKRKITPNHVGPINLQICENWNRRIGGCKIKESVGRDCPRRHVCLHCETEGHEVFKCPLKLQLAAN
jgi:hypothetical protein